AVGAWPSVHEKVEATNRSVARRIIRVREFRLRGEIALELNPVEALHVFVGVGFDEGVEFAICDVVKDKAVGADILCGYWQMDLNIGIVTGGYGRARDFTVG